MGRSATEPPIAEEAVPGLASEGAEAISGLANGVGEAD